jgi:putative copper resistance protein D
VRSQILLTAWVGLAVAAGSGVVWFQLQAVSMTGLPLREAMTSEVLSTVLNETQFGLVLKVRLALAIILAVCLALDRRALLRRVALGAALGFIAAIAWCGHAASTPGVTGSLHLTADVLHLLAAAGWLGGLVPLTLLFAAARRHQVSAGTLAAEAAQRFSTFGIVSVAALLVSGFVDAWILVGSFRMLLVTEYGRLLLLKVAVFSVMLGFAAVNRLWLTPQLALPSKGAAQHKALGQLRRNTLVEIVLGLAIFAIVGALGTMHPAAHLISSLK